MVINSGFFKSKEVFLVYPVLNSLQDMGYNYGLGYISSVLKKGGYSTKYFILRKGEDILEFYKLIKTVKPSVIAFSVNTSQFEYTKKIVKEMRDFFKGFVVLGGPHPTFYPDCIYEIESDAIVRGEGEFALLDLLNALKSRKDYTGLKNFWFKSGEEIIKNSLREPIENLDDLPYPDKESLDYQKVLDYSGGVNSSRLVNRFIFSRGCLFSCTYCSNKPTRDLYGGNWSFRQRSPKKAINEIMIDLRKYKFTSIAFDDDSITMDKKWFYEFFNLYKKNFDIPFRCNIDIRNVDEDMMILLKDAGAKGIGIGIEHGNEQFRRKVLNRSISNEQIMKVHDICEKLNIDHNFFIMVGFPYETRKLFLDTVKLCRKLGVKPDNTLSIFHPYPGTELGELCYSKRWIPCKKKYIERHHAVIDYPLFKAKDIKLCRDIFPILMEYKWLPLFIPFGPLLQLHNLVSFLKRCIYGRI